MTAKIIPLFADPERTCFACDNGYCGLNGIICEITRDFVADESVAKDCEMFETGQDNDAA